ncbi:methionyl-tRNA formyltransferase [Actinomycetospora endophytica]|uniref:Methionyl-tRNA formyltransferase n=1 Tax=Actinomycetospora endophytica TaxID=2291215 RepID=A0ABS8PHY0_9PSEU|nr:methionyl-tRNA formyltransferase [Actinomycetospora endophytica]MCD2197832.1 methionyl-tRNA formyltransferase [Actinomycetospora endophytica]
MRVVFAGTPEPAVPSLRRLLESGEHEVVAVVTRPDAPAGRRRTLQRSPIGALADEAGVEVLTPAKPSDPEFLDRLRTIAPDCAPVVAYGNILRPAALAIPAHGWVNLHFSLLPAWRGAAPVQAAIRAGDELTGATTFRLEEGMDTGPVFGTVTEKVADDDTAGALLERLAVSGAGLLVATLDGIADGSLTAVPQPAEGVSVAPKVTVDDARVRWSDPPLAIDRLVRSVTPAPGAWTEFRGQRVKIGPVSTTGFDDLAPGELRVEKRRVLVGTAGAPVALGTVQPAGRPAMPAVDWTRGAQPAAGERFE